MLCKSGNENYYNHIQEGSMGNINEQINYIVSKTLLKTHCSIQDMLDTRIKLEQMVPSITMNRGYNKRIFLDCATYYAQSGLDYVESDVIDVRNKRLSLKVDYKKLDKYLENKNNSEFGSLDQALSILAIGNPIEILKSENFIESTLRHNKDVKRNQIMNSTGFDIQETALQDLVKMFKGFEDRFRRIIECAHNYITLHPTM